MTIFLKISPFLFLLYVIKKPLKEFIKFICDDFIGEVILKIGGWIEPEVSELKKVRTEFTKRLEPKRVVGSAFLFMVTLLLCVLNYHLIYYGMELLLPSEKKLVTFGFTPAGLASMVIMLAEVTLGFLILEILKITDIFDWDKFKNRTRWIVGTIFVLTFLLLVGVEVGTAMKRIYEIQDPSQSSKIGLEKFMMGLPYWVTALLTIVIPFFNAFSAYSLRDIFLSLGAIIISIFIIILQILNILHKRLHFLITHLDDLLDIIIKILTWPIELIINGLLFIFIKLKLAKPSLIIFVIIIPYIFLTTSCSKNITNETFSNKVLTVLLDNSGSFDKYLDQAIGHCINYINILRGGDTFVLFLIDAWSLEQKELPVVLSLPESETTIETRKFRENIKFLKKNAVEKLLNIKKRRRSKHTDIAGAISRASLFLNSNQFSKHKKFLLIYSDMQDTQGRKLIGLTSLNGVCVKILFADITEKTRAAIENWKRKILELGASKVEILTPDNCKVQKNFFLDCE